MNILYKCKILNNEKPVPNLPGKMSREITTKPELSNIHSYGDQLILIKI